MIIAYLEQWKEFGGGLEPKHDDIFKISPHLEINILKVSHSKTVTVAFHLNNGEAKHELAVYNNNNLLLHGLFCPVAI